MKSENGYNPMRYDCERQGCFNLKRRPKIEMFSECFPGRINFGDVDAEVEINGYSLRLEWKSYAGDLPQGQQILFSRKTRYGIETVICVCGDAETMVISAIGLFWLGKWRGWTDSDIDGLKRHIKNWSDWALKQPPISSIAGVMSCVFRQFKTRDVLAYIASDIDRKERRLALIDAAQKARSEDAA